MSIAAMTTVTSNQINEREWFTQIRSEIDKYLTMMQDWADGEPDEILRQISSIAARLTEIRVQLMRDSGQRAQRLRLNEIDPILSQIEFQFKVTSRRHAVREMDWQLARGQ